MRCYKCINKEFCDGCDFFMDCDIYEEDLNLDKNLEIMKLEYEKIN